MIKRVCILCKGQNHQACKSCDGRGWTKVDLAKGNRVVIRGVAEVGVVVEVFESSARVVGPRGRFMYRIEQDLVLLEA